MSTLPLLLSFADEIDNLTTNNYDEFGFNFYPHRHYYNNSNLQMSTPPRNFLQRHRSRKLEEEPVSLVGEEGFHVTMDVQNFKPNEIAVKTVDNFVIVEGKHDEREDEHGFISRQFLRKYPLPKGYDPSQVQSTLSSDGVLTVSAAYPDNPETNERIIEIQHIGPSNLPAKDKPRDEGEKSKQDAKE